MPFVIDKFKSKTELQYQKNSTYFTEVQYWYSEITQETLSNVYNGNNSRHL